MNYYSHKEIISAIGNAYDEISRSKKSLLGWRWSHNDCWSLFCKYDNFLRDGKSLIEGKVTGYTSDFTFLKQFHSAGYEDFPSMFSKSGYQIVSVSDRQTGDVVIARGLHYNTMTSMIDIGKGWLNSGPDPKFDLIPYNMVSKVYAIGRPIKGELNESA